MRIALAVSASLLMSGLGCTNEKNTSPAQTALTSAMSDAAVIAADTAKSAKAVIHGAGDTHDTISGAATFTATSGGLKVVVDITGLKPGKHGIHIHQKPDLSDPKLISAGDHFNPGGTDHKHAGPTDAKRHAGDLGNIEVDDKGKGHLEITDDALTVDGATGVIGHSIIIHEKEDDYQTQKPPGNAGGRVAGGAIIASAG